METWRPSLVASMEEREGLEAGRRGAGSRILGSSSYTIWRKENVKMTPPT